MWQRRVGAGDQWVLTEVDPERLTWDAEHPTWPTNKPVSAARFRKKFTGCEVSTVEVGPVCDDTRDSCVAAG
ncbi:UNVERIFIED_CONTAM: hypothetical protein RKD50_009195 [Streptomyces canus]